jgi:peptidoglycan/LPS O-acetylase OafA/YrhL
VHYLSHYRIDSILWGGTAALLSSRLHLSDQARRWLMVVGGVLIVGLVLSDTMSVFLVGKPLGFSLGFSLLSLTASLVLLDLVAHPTSWGARLLEFPMLARVGKLSYGMYLLHLPMIDLAMVLIFAVPRQPTPMNLVLALVLFIVMTYAAAWVLYRLVEAPCLRIKDRVAGGSHPVV